MNSHIFIIEIDKQGSKEQERLRWRWPPSESDSSATADKGGTIAEELMLFLNQNLGIDDGDGGAGVGVEVPRAAIDDDDRPGYIVEMCDLKRGGWVPLANPPFTGSIPKNCRLRVSVPARVELPRASDKTSSTVCAESGEHRTGAAVDAPLALPWRHFDRDLGSGGMEVRGRKLVIQDVPNSDAGTGLFTWDGSVLLAKYVEHRATEIIGATDGRHGHHPLDEEQLPGSDPCGECSIDGSDSRRDLSARINGRGRSEVSRRAFRALELGCGTGLAGLASAFALGEQLRGESKSVTTSASGLTLRHRGITAAATVEVSLTDLPYVLANTRANVARNAELLKAAEVDVVVRELDWLRPVPPELIGGKEFDLILAADVVWLDDLVGPLVRTLERLTAGWTADGENNGEDPCASSASSPRPDRAPTASSFGVGVAESSSSCSSARGSVGRGGWPAAALVDVASGGGQCASRGDSREGGVRELARDDAGENDGRCYVAWEGEGDSGLRRRRLTKRRVLLAYQWRSERTGRALLRELEKTFHVREIRPEECHPDYLPSSKSLCLFEAVRRDVR